MKAVPVTRSRVAPRLVHYVVFFSLAIAGCLADLATKSWIFGRLGTPDHQQTWWIWEDVVGFQTSLNQGALFGMGQGWVAAFAALSVIAALGILGWLVFGRTADLLLTTALGCVMAGILGNLYDRLGMHGLMDDRGETVYAVRDWILVMIGDWPWPTFNIADSLLVCGAALLLWHAFWSKPEGDSLPAEQTTS